MDKDLEFNIENIIEIEKKPMNRESDRGFVLLETADIENQMTELLKTVFLALDKLSKSQEKHLFDYTGPFGTFSSKIHLCKAMNIIDNDLFMDLNKLRKIRNIAAHSNNDFTLSDCEIGEILNSLNNNYERTGLLKRYSLTTTGSDYTGEGNETILKGYGFIRFDKVNFMFTMKKIKSLIKARKDLFENYAKKISNDIKIINKIANEMTNDIDVKLKKMREE